MVGLNPHFYLWIVSIFDSHFFCMCALFFFNIHVAWFIAALALDIHVQGLLPQFFACLLCIRSDQTSEVEHPIPHTHLYSIGVLYQVDIGGVPCSALAHLPSKEYYLQG